jgi:hypothetical protein
VKLDPYLGEIRVETAFATQPDEPAPAFFDVTDFVSPTLGISITRGRQDEQSKPTAATCAVGHDNTLGHFTPGYPGSQFYPNVKVRRKTRVAFRDLTIPGNMVDAESASFEGGTVGQWGASGSVPPTLTNDTTHPHSGTKGMLITWGTGGSFPLAKINAFSINCVIGRTYKATAWVWVPTGSPDPLLVVPGVILGVNTSVKDNFAQLSITFTATGPVHGLQVWPATAPTAGQQCWVDDVVCDEAAAPGTFTTNPPPTIYRYTGYLDDLPTEWPGGGDYSEAQIVAIDRFKRMGKTTAFRSIIEQEYKLDSPFAHYTLGDAAGSTMAGDVSTQGRPALVVTHSVLGSGGTLTFGTATGPGTDGLTAAQFTPNTSTDGYYLTKQLVNDGGFFRDFDASIECFFLTSSAVDQPIIQLHDYNQSNPLIQVGTSAAGKLTLYTDFGTVRIQSAASVANGATHHLAATAHYNGTAYTYNLYLDGTLVGTYTTDAVGWTPWLSMNFDVGGGVNSSITFGAFNGVIAHAAIYNTALSATRVLAHANAGLNGFSGERSDQRIGRYASYLGIPAAEQTLEVGLSTSIPTIDITGAAPLQAMQDIESTESGLLFMGRDGNLTFQSRNHRYAAASAMTISAEDIEADFAKFITNDQYLVNDVTASRPGGVTLRRVNQASIGEYGDAQPSGGPVVLLTTSDNEVEDAANWKANTTTIPSPRMPVLKINLLTHPALAAQLLALDISSRITINNLPATASASAIDLFIEGYTEVITDTEWSLAFNTSPATASGVWILDSATYSQLDVSTRLAY